MQTHNLVQGSPEWNAYRAKHFNASDAPVMMGVSPYKTRSQLLHEIATGLVPDVDESTQRRLDDGHRFEALARPLAEGIIGQDLYPVTGSNGMYSASFDGLTMMEDISFEHKTLNDNLRKVKSYIDLDEHYRIQMEQQLMVCDAAKCLFMATKWDGDALVEKIAVWYEPDLKLRHRIIDGWEQFEKDLADYVPAVIVEAPKAEPIKDLPAVIINASGGLSVCNLAEVTPVFDLFINNAKTELVTDEDFANGEETAKKSRRVAKTLKMKAKEVIDQIATVGDAVRTLELYAEKFDKLGLTLENAVKDQKEAIKYKIMADAKAAYLDHVNELYQEIKPIELATCMPDFASAMKNKRTLASLHDSVNTMLTNAKIEADAIARDLRSKLDSMRTFESFKFLFNDLQQIISKPRADFDLLVTSRIDAHKKAEFDKVEAAKVAEAARIAAAVEAERKAGEERAAAAIEAERMATARMAAEAEQKQTAEDQRGKAEPVGISSPALASTPLTPEENRTAVIDAQDDIAAFMNARDFGKEPSRIRAILVEFVKFRQAALCGMPLNQGTEHGIS